MLHETHDTPTTAISPAFMTRIPEIVSTLSGVVADVPHGGRQWVFYGSLPLGAGTAASDLDAMLLHDGIAGVSPERRDATWDGRPVTVYVLSRQDLADDATGRRFGGYFALKLFSPFCSDVHGGTERLMEVPARFLGPLSVSNASPAGPWTADQLLARAYLAFMALYPAFGSYVARLIREPGLMGPVWSHQRASYVTALHAAGLVEPIPGGTWKYTGPAEEVNEVRDRCTARFWAFGAVCHGSEIGFPDLYFSKADVRADRSEQDAAIGFLHAIAAGGASC